MVNPTPYRINNPGTRQIHLFAEADAEISMNFSMRVGWGVGDGYSETNGDGATVSYNFPILEVTDSEPVNFGDPDGDRIVERAWLTTSNNLQTILGLDYERYLQTADGETELEAELHCRF